MPIQDFPLIASFFDPAAISQCMTTWQRFHPRHLAATIRGFLLPHEKKIAALETDLITLALVNKSLIEQVATLRNDLAWCESYFAPKELVETHNEALLNLSSHDHRDVDEMEWHIGEMLRAREGFERWGSAYRH